MSKERAGQALDDAARLIRQASEEDSWDEAKDYFRRAASSLDDAAREIKRD